MFLAPPRLEIGLPMPANDDADGIAEFKAKKLFRQSFSVRIRRFFSLGGQKNERFFPVSERCDDTLKKFRLFACEKRKISEEKILLKEFFSGEKTHFEPHEGRLCRLFWMIFSRENRFFSADFHSEKAEKWGAVQL